MIRQSVRNPTALRNVRTVGRDPSGYVVIVVEQKPARPAWMVPTAIGGGVALVAWVFLVTWAIYQVLLVLIPWLIAFGVPSFFLFLGLIYRMSRR